MKKPSICNVRVKCHDN